MRLDPTACSCLSRCGWTSLAVYMYASQTLEGSFRDERHIVILLLYKITFTRMCQFGWIWSSGFPILCNAKKMLSRNECSGLDLLLWMSFLWMKTNSGEEGVRMSKLRLSFSSQISNRGKMGSDTCHLHLIWKIGQFFDQDIYSLKPSAKYLFQGNNSVSNAYGV